MQAHFTDSDWQLQLISLFCWLDDGFTRRGWDALCMRFSNHHKPLFTDAEVLAVYLFARLRGHHMITQAHRFAADFLAAFFPLLPNYSAFVDRLERLLAPLERALEELTDQVEPSLFTHKIIDSCPIVVASSKRAGRAKVAADLASPGWCSSKSQYYYGIKLHLLAHASKGQMPIPMMAGVSAAREADIRAISALEGSLEPSELYADLAYQSQTHSKALEQVGVELKTPRKKTKGSYHFEGKCAASRAVSSKRQPIESFFAWLQEKTHFQNAHRVRSTQGLLIFVWSSLLVGMLLLCSTPD